MKILLINKYFYLRGGSEVCFFDTARILKDKGHAVSFFAMQHPRNLPVKEDAFFVSYIDYQNPGSVFRQLHASIRLVYSWEARRRLEELLRIQKPDIVHLHNIHHQISPSILHTLKKHRLPVVMTLHDYKMVCPVYTMFNRGETCEKCCGQKFFSCIRSRCKQNSIAKSSLNYLEMVLHHKLLKIYNLVDIFISPSIFLQRKLADCGFTGQIQHLPNPVDGSLFTPSYSWKDESLLYAGRLAEEKGLFTLLQAVKGQSINCDICGTGPLAKELEQYIAREKITNVTLHGHIPQTRLRSLLADTMFVVTPSEWWENFPYAVSEAFAAGKPVLAARSGGLPELVIDELTGLTYPAGDVEEFRHKILYLKNNSAKIVAMGKNARGFIEKHLDPDLYYNRLLEIYRKALEING